MTPPTAAVRTGQPRLTPEEIRTSITNLKLERDAIVLYDALASMEPDVRRAGAFRTIAGNERRHAEIWSRRLEEVGASVPPLGRARLRVRLIIRLARLLGTRAVSELVKSLEGDEEEIYSGQLGPEVASIAADEREHAEIWKRLDAEAASLTARAVEGSQSAEFADVHAAAAARGAAAADAVASGATAPAGAAPVGVAPLTRGTRRKDEAWHRAGQSGTLRAAVFGINDGLVSNLSLVMGIAGAAADNHIIVLTGVAGLLAGSFSMAAGEWVSMKSQRELFERQIALEREELRVMPDAEEEELAQIFRNKGLGDADARRVASRLMADPEAALDTKVREELGLDPEELGSAWGAAAYSLVAFALGALVPLVPFLLATGVTALVASLTFAFLALFLVGAAVSLLTGRSALFSGTRQVLIGAAAAAVTFAVGSLIGGQVAG